MIFKDLDRIVFAGDSVTDMGSVNPVGEGLYDSLGHSYVRELKIYSPQYIQKSVSVLPIPAFPETPAAICWRAGSAMCDS